MQCIFVCCLTFRAIPAAKNDSCFGGPDSYRLIVQQLTKKEATGLHDGPLQLVAAKMQLLDTTL